MKLTLITVALLATSLFTIAASSRSARLDADRKAIAELHARDTKATLAYDIDTLSGILAEDIVGLPPGQPPTLGRAAAREQMEQGRGAAAQFEAIDYKQDWQDLRIDGDHAYEWGYFTSVVRPKAGGDVIRARYKVLRVLERQKNGSWLVSRTMWNEAPKE